MLNITLPCSAVDVNVHPAKTEVKFLREREVFDCVHYGVKGALNRTPGEVPFEDIRDGVADAALDDKISQTYSDQVAAWVEEASPVYHLDRF